MDWEYFYLPILIILIIYLPGFSIVSALFPLKNQLDARDDRLYRTMLSFIIGIFYIVFSLAILHIFPSPGFRKWPLNFDVALSVEVFGIVFFLFIAWRRNSYIFRNHTVPAEMIEKFSEWRNKRFRKQLLSEMHGRGDDMNEKEKLEYKRIEKDVEITENELGKIASEFYENEKRK